MKKVLNIFFISILFLSPALPHIHAQGMMNSASWDTASDPELAKEEALGKDLIDRLHSQEISCTDLSLDNFDSIGEYYIGQMAGNSHSAMNQMMTTMIGEDGEKAMHIVLAKRLSGCDPNASYPKAQTGFFAPMSMMVGYNMPWWGNSTGHFGMFSFGLAPVIGIIGAIIVAVFWIFIIIFAVRLIKWIIRSAKEESKSKTVLDILKERYARGDIDKKEYEEKKKDLQ